MARPKNFDTETVKEEAVQAFWRHGYNGTSVNELLAEMNLPRQSLYGAFGDKKQLFLAALEKYDAERFTQVSAMLDRPGSAKTAIRDFILRIAVTCAGHDGEKGCLIIKAAMELAPQDKDVADWLKRVTQRNQKWLAGVIRRGQKQGDISRDLNATVAARYLVASLGGLRVLGMSAPSAKAVREVAQMILKVLD